METVSLKKRDKIFLLRLQDEIEQRKLNPSDVFKEFDKNKDGALSWHEFGGLLRDKLGLEDFGNNFMHVYIYIYL